MSLNFVESHKKPRNNLNQRRNGKEKGVNIAHAYRFGNLKLSPSQSAQTNLIGSENSSESKNKKRDIKTDIGKKVVSADNAKKKKPHSVINMTASRGSEKKDNLDYSDPKVISGWLRPSRKLTGKTQKRSFFKSRVLLLLILQFMFYILAWMIDKYVITIPWNIIVVCGFVSLFFIPISAIMMLKFSKVSPINYLFICVYNIFSLPYFFSVIRFVDDTIVTQFFILYAFLIGFFAIFSLVLPKITGFFTGVIISLVMVLIINVAIFLPFIETTLYRAFLSSYVAMVCIGFILYYINHPLKCYGYTDYIAAFIDINLFTAIKAFKRTHYYMTIIICIGLIVVLFFEKMLFVIKYV